MALKMRKDIKKALYYVWFLGAQESKGLRGAEYIVPAVKTLIQREREMEPFKVTLQVSHKGLKIIQNVPAPVKGKNKPEVVKHFIPHHAVTCVLQDEDIVACILLLYNPVTKCPVHVHAYRCDSVETADILRGHLHALIERPDNQKKLGEMETRLRAKGVLVPSRGMASASSDGRSTRESESSGGSSSERQERIATLYDSLAAELREKLGATKAPILLPPKDYDTVHRQKGNLTAAELRRCLNSSRTPGSSGGSSGIGSDHAPSPDPRFIDNRSSSEDECWSGDVSLPRARRVPSTGAEPRRRQRSPSPTAPLSPRDRFKDAKEKFQLLEREHQLKKAPDLRQRTASPSWGRERDSEDELEERYRRSAPEPAPRRPRSPQPAPRHRVPSSEPPRRPLYDPAAEEERRRSSHELAREFKRRSYQDAGYGYHELPNHERFPGLDRESARHHPHQQQQHHHQEAARYRHSYAEGPLHHDVLHRTSSSVSSGRVGIAAIHPY